MLSEAWHSPGASSVKICGHIWTEHETGTRADCRTNSSICSVVGARRARDIYREGRIKDSTGRVVGFETKCRSGR